MVVLSASVCTRQGKALLSRQFVEMNRLRVEGLLAAFPKLIGHAKQHTFVETDAVRYVYQPLENNLYLLLITTKASNIVEDLGTLRLLAKVVPDVAGGLQEHVISDSAFDLIFAFDEVLSAGGYKEDATLSSIRNNLIMDSYEEKIAVAQQKEKELAAKVEMQKKAKTLQDEKVKNAFGQGGAPGAMPGRMEGFGGGGAPQANSGFMDQFNSEMNGAAQPQQEFNPYSSLQQAAPTPVAPKVLAKGGMKLGGGSSAGKQGNFMAAMAAEDNLLPMGGKGSPGDAFNFNAAVAPPAAAPSTPLTLALEEKLTCSMNREGAIETCEVKGTLTLTANTDVGAAAIVAVNKTQLPSAFNFATHPRIDKKTYEQKGTLVLKGGKGFPVARPVGILRWSYNNDDAAPLTINCWPEDEGSGTVNVNIEMELTRTDLVLQDVNILLPLGTTDPPVIAEIDGQYRHDPASGMMCWHFDVVDANTNSTGSLEFSVAGSNPDAFFPVQIGFRSETLLCPLAITGVTHSTNGTTVPNQTTKSFTPESYQCA